MLFLKFILCREVLVTELKSLHTELIHLETYTLAVNERFGQLVLNHRRFLSLLQMLGCTSEDREALEDLINNEVDNEKAVKLYI